MLKNPPNAFIESFGNTNLDMKNFKGVHIDFSQKCQTPELEIRNSFYAATKRFMAILSGNSRVLGIHHPLLSQFQTRWTNLIFPRKRLVDPQS